MTRFTRITSNAAPAAIGTYSQAVQYNGLIFLSGQIPLNPDSMELVSDDFTDQIEQVFTNLLSVCQAAEGDLSHVLKLTIYLTDLSNFNIVNEVMAKFFRPPYPARAAVQVAALPRSAQVEIDGIMAQP
ncbi:MAG: Rid family detoxifying hydrolase [Gammaproteobacteria bacterium]|nr:Rid family detoxifying hydrolase [Gammaproteobacteria bacterium]